MGQSTSPWRRHPSVSTGLPVGVGDITGHFARVILIQPAIRQCLLNIRPLHRIRLQERAQEVDGPCEMGQSAKRTRYRPNTGVDAVATASGLPPP